MGLLSQMSEPGCRLAGNRAGAVCYNLAHAYVAPAVLLLSYVASGTRWCAFAGLVWAFHIAGDRVLGYGLKFTSGFQDTHLGTIGKQRLPRAPAGRPHGPSHPAGLGQSPLAGHRVPDLPLRSVPKSSVYQLLNQATFVLLTPPRQARQPHSGDIQMTVFNWEGAG
jgi:hypothetical protein